MVTIKEALEENEHIKIQYVIICQCSKCKDRFMYCDDEYSFEGNIEDFREYATDYGVLELDDKVEHIAENVYRYSKTSEASELCQVCINFF